MWCWQWEGSSRGCGDTGPRDRLEERWVERGLEGGRWENCSGQAVHGGTVLKSLPELGVFVRYQQRWSRVEYLPFREAIKKGREFCSLLSHWAQKPGRLDPKGTGCPVPAALSLLTPLSPGSSGWSGFVPQRHRNWAAQPSAEAE